MFLLTVDESINKMLITLINLDSRDKLLISLILLRSY